MKQNFFDKVVSLNNTKVNVIVEISGNHQSSYSILKKLVNKAIRNKADIIKFQVYKPETITFNSNNKDFKVEKTSKWSNYKNLFELYKDAHTPWEWIAKIAKYLNAIQFPWFASVFDDTSIDFLENLNCKAYKLASPEITDISLIKKIAKTKKPIILSTGVSEENDISLAINTIKKYHKKFAILKCTSSYPAPYDELDLLAIQTIKSKYKCAVGFSDHSLGTIASKTAVALGATIIEKHFKLDNDNKSVDAHFSTNISELKYLKNEYFNIIKTLGSDKIRVTKSAKKGQSGMRSLYVIKDIKKGERFSKFNLKSIRPAYGLHPKYFDEVINKKSNKDIHAGSRLTKDMIKNFVIKDKLYKRLK